MGSDSAEGVAALAAGANNTEDIAQNSGLVPRQLEPKANLMNGGSAAFFVTPSDVGSNFIDCTVVAKADIPVPRWLVPLSLWKRVIAGVFSNTFTKLNERVVQRWGDL